MAFPSAFRLRAGIVSVGIFGLGWLLYHFTMAPLHGQERASRDRIAELDRKIEGARKASQAIIRREQDAAEARQTLRQIHRTFSGPAVVWFPLQIKQHFAHYGIPDGVARLNTVAAVPGLSEFEQAYWAVDLPLNGNAADMSKLFTAVAELEEKPGVRVIDLAIRRDDEAARPTAIINVSSLVRR